MSRFKQYLQKIITKSIIEIVAVFIGITLAFFIDNYRHEKDKFEITKKYYSLLNQELSNDSAYMALGLEEMKFQIEHIDTFIYGAENGSVEIMNQQLLGIDVEIKSNNKMAIANTLLESNAFNELYDTLIFSDLNTLRTIQENFNKINNRIEVEKLKLDDRYFNKIYNYSSKTFDVNSIEDKNQFLNELIRFKKLLEERKMYQMSLIDMTKKLLVEVKSYV